jgi:DNA recombination protein RmuC
MEIGILIAVGAFGALLGAGIGLVLGRYVWPAAGGEVVAVLTERVSSLTRQLQEQGELRKQVTTEFENIANRFLDQSALKLSNRSKELLDPLRELLQKLQATRESEIRAVTELRTDIENVRKTSSDIGNQAEGLAKALRGNPQILGHWGEIQLEDILQGVGLEKDLQYIKQGKDLNLKSEDGGHQKPDFIVLLPEKRAIIVDSKVSLAAFTI